MKCLAPKKLYTWSDGRKLPYKPENPRYATTGFQWVPCRKCTFCVRKKQNEWALRIEHESMQHETSLFVTATYDNDHLPVTQAQLVEDKDRWLDTWRHYSKREYGRGIRYFVVAEHGDRTHRVHFHACIFSGQFHDLTRLAGSGPYPKYRSAEATRLWGYGNVELGLIGTESAKYVAAYNQLRERTMFEEVDFDGAVERHFSGEVREIDGQPYWLHSTGEWLPRKEATVWMSRRPGIGATFVDKFHNQFPSGLRDRGGYHQGLPDYYLRRTEVIDPELHSELKRQRREAPKDDDHLDPKRMSDELTYLRAREGLKHKPI